ncbi:MAG: alpha/beta hydrolase [Gemmatimonadales bacterium]
MIAALAIAIALASLVGLPTTASSQRMTLRDLMALPQPAPDTIIAYGADSLQFGELFLPRPRGTAVAPVAVLIHGGCWLSGFDRRHLRQLATTIAGEGIAVWSIEYRRVGNPGAGWPGTFEDIANGVDHVRRLAGPFRLDTTRAVVAGHSAGGHFALWAAARGRLPADAPGAGTPLQLRGAVGIAGVPDLAVVVSGERSLCGDAIRRLMGGSPSEVPELYRLASPGRLLPLGVEQVVISGADDAVVPADLSRRYTTDATAAGDRIRLIVIPDAGHFEVVSAGTPAGAEVIRAIVTLARR